MWTVHVVYDNGRRPVAWDGGRIEVMQGADDEPARFYARDMESVLADMIGRHAGCGYAWRLELELVK
jgi:hypothetical protein